MVISIYSPLKHSRFVEEKKTILRKQILFIDRKGFSFQRTSFFCSTALTYIIFTYFFFLFLLSHFLQNWWEKNILGERGFFWGWVLPNRIPTNKKSPRKILLAGYNKVTPKKDLTQALISILEYARVFFRQYTFLLFFFSFI